MTARIEAPQRGSTRFVYEAKWTIFTKWCLSNQVDFRAPPLKAIADFLLYLFQDKKLQPGTIDGYRSAIADKLGSGKRRSEIHAWLHKNISHQSDCSKVSLYPSPSFLSKNQLAKEGPDSVAPVVIPALAPSLDKSLKGDRSLCPVRALRYYLDRTSDLRQNKELVFVSFKKGLTKTSHLPLSPHGSNGDPVL